jgi:hypothetical protein
MTIGASLQKDVQTAIGSIMNDRKKDPLTLCLMWNLEPSQKHPSYDFRQLHVSSVFDQKENKFSDSGLVLLTSTFLKAHRNRLFVTLTPSL